MMDNWNKATGVQKLLAGVLFLCAAFGVFYYFFGDHSFKTIGAVALFLMFGLVALRPKRTTKK